VRKIIVGAQVSIDGFMQAPGGPAEDPTRGFRYGGWAMPYFDQTAGDEMDRLFKEKFDLLLGRKTYEIFRRVLALLRRELCPWWHRQSVQGY
jgi:dihydrofolate reductase